MSELTVGDGGGDVVQEPRGGHRFAQHVATAHQEDRVPGQTVKVNLRREEKHKENGKRRIKHHKNILGPDE